MNDRNYVKSRRQDAIANLACGQLAQALEWAELAMQTGSDALDLAFAAKVFVAANKHDRAEMALKLAIGQTPAMDAPFADLALLNLRQKDAGKAVQNLSDSLHLNPVDSECRLLMGFARYIDGNLASGIEVLEELLQFRPDFESAWELLRHFFVVVADTTNVIEVNRRWLNACPESASARYLLKTVEGEDIPDRACQEYISESFDRTAEYQDSIQGALDYKGIESLGLMLEKIYPVVSRDKVVLDAGCGTGQAATWLRPHANQLVGTDLSPKMLDVARRTGCYDKLLQCDLFDHLEKNVSTYDLVAAIDSFCYFGDLEKLIPITLAALRPGGRAIFSLDPGQLSPDTWFIQPNGRFSHSPPYIIRVMGENGIPDGTIRRVKWRTENGKDYFVLLIAIERPDSPEDKSPAQ